MLLVVASPASAMEMEKFLNPKDFYASIGPFLAVAKIFGVKPIGREEGAYARSNLQYVFMCANFGIFATSFYFSFFEVEALSNDITVVYFTSFQIYDLIIYIRFLLIYFFCLKYCNDEIELYKCMDKLDGLLESVGRLNELLTANKTLLVKACYVLAFSLFTHLVTETFVLVISFNFVTTSIIIKRSLPALIGTLMKCYFYLWTTALRQRFEMINNTLRLIKKQSTCKKKYMFSVYKFEKELSKLMDLHKELLKAARMVNSLFQVELIWHFMLIFIVSLANGYYLMYIVVNKSASAFVYAFSIVKNFTFFYFEMFVLVKSSVSLCEEANKTKDILSAIQIETYDESSHRLVIASMYELKENKLEITACRLFNITYSTMFSMMSNIANYIFIALQLKTD